jgi:hypothetical protein
MPKKTTGTPRGDIFERLLLSTGICLKKDTCQSLRVLLDSVREVRPLANQAVQQPRGLPQTLVCMAEQLCDMAEHREMPILMAALALEAAGIPFNFNSVATHG